MPVLTRRQQALATRQLTSKRMSTDSNETMGEHLWVVDEDCERPQKEMDFPSTPLGKAPSSNESRGNLRISTYTASDLHDRYMSSEEEPSPSPVSEHEGAAEEEEEEEELKHKTPAARTDEAAESQIFDECKAEIAIAVPIMAMGRPRLVDITNLAPIHKRKRTDKSILSRTAMKMAASRTSMATVENTAPDTAKLPIPEEPLLPKRKDSIPMLAPDSWLPEEDAQEEDEHYFPGLELRNPPTYNDYDPYSLDPPRLSPRNSYTVPPTNPGGIASPRTSIYNDHPTKKPGSIARARQRTNPPPAMNNNPLGWKGLTRSLSMAKKHDAYLPAPQVAKKPKMLPRGPTEREELPVIPPFPFEDKSVVAV